MVESSFKPLGIDYITFACSDRMLWKEHLQRLGFVRAQVMDYVDTLPRPEALVMGDLRVVLIDPETHGNTAKDFVEKHGEMQIIYADVLVDSYLGALQELLSRGVAHRSVLKDEMRDPFGEAWKIRLDTPESSVTWRLCERLKYKYACRPPYQDLASTGVDHFAIAVDNLEMWQEYYHRLGFETIYVPDGPIVGKYSGMDTVALRRGGWTIAICEGVDKGKPSQVSNYRMAHGEHSVQHAAIGFPDLSRSVDGLLSRNAQFRLRRLKEDPNTTFIIHEGEDHSGPLFQCFTKPLAKPSRYEYLASGFFFELIQRCAPGETLVSEHARQSFDDRTVVGLYESIENEELEGDRELILPLERYSPRGRKPRKPKS